MALYLTTGVPGAGKTLYTVAKALPVIQAQEFEYQGSKMQRRLMVGGIPNLLLEHELIDVPVVDVETYKDEWSSMRRDPGDAPLDVPNRADNWWLWCKPGDVIVVDECQRLFRPMAAGRKIPAFIAKLETHRHYGVDFVLITQHPQLLHTNVRNLIGRHQHVRRMFGGGGTVIYEWDHCTHPDKTKTAAVTYWRHDKKAFGLYKSAEVHTKPATIRPYHIYIALLAVVVFLLLGYRFYQRRIAAPMNHEATGATQVQPGQAVAPAAVASGPSRQQLRARAVFVSSHMPPPSPEDLAQLPDHVAGCFVVGDRCQCVTTKPARIQEGYGQFCSAVMAGLFSIPPHRVPTPSSAAPAPSGLAGPSPAVAAASGANGGV